jgi:thioredoxin reductase (NADPH)
LGEEVVTGVRVKNITTGNTQDLVCGGLFVAIGHEPATTAFVGQVDLDEKGYITTKQGSWVETSREGVFAAGDCVDHRYRQAVTAAGFGCMAALEAHWYLENKGI